MLTELSWAREVMHFAMFSKSNDMIWSCRDRIADIFQAIFRFRGSTEIKHISIKECYLGACIDHKATICLARYIKIELSHKVRRKHVLWMLNGIHCRYSLISRSSVHCVRTDSVEDNVYVCIAINNVSALDLSHGVHLAKRFTKMELLQECSNATSY